MTSCPYCDNPFPHETRDRFQACRACGFRSARVSDSDGDYLVIDSNLPDLVSRYQELMDTIGAAVIIDRRVSHNQIAGPERRRFHN